MKKVFLILTVFICLCGCDIKNNYSVELKNQTITICGEKKLLVDYTHDNEFDINTLVKEIEYCNDILSSDKEFYKQHYVELVEDYNNRLQELGINEYILSDTSR